MDFLLDILPLSSVFWVSVFDESSEGWGKRMVGEVELVVVKVEVEVDVIEG
jgi:hypothetical protein